MIYLRFSKNQLTGSLVIKKVPSWMENIDARVNHFSAVGTIDSKQNAIINLQGSGVTSVVDENGRAQDIKPFLE